MSGGRDDGSGHGKRKEVDSTEDTESTSPVKRSSRAGRGVINKLTYSEFGVNTRRDFILQPSISQLIGYSQVPFQDPEMLADDEIAPPEIAPPMVAAAEIAPPMVAAAEIAPPLPSAAEIAPPLPSAAEIAPPLPSAAEIAPPLPAASKIPQVDAQISRCFFCNNISPAPIPAAQIPQIHAQISRCFFCNNISPAPIAAAQIPRVPVAAAQLGAGIHSRIQALQSAAQGLLVLGAVPTTVVAETQTEQGLLSLPASTQTDDQDLLSGTDGTQTGEPGQSSSVKENGIGVHIRFHDE
jgi:hypothetical protein